jgi:hypothetical protein
MAFGYSVYFTERLKNRVVRWEPDTGDVEIVAGEPKDDDPTQKLRDPYGLAFDKDGYLLISDKLNCRLVRLKKGRLEPLTLRDVNGHRNRLPTSPRDYTPRLLAPAGLFARKDGALLCAFFNDHTIYRIHTDGRLEHLLGIVRNRGYFLGAPSETVPEAAIPDTPVHWPACAVERKDGTIVFIERGAQAVREYHPGQGIKSVFPFSSREEWGPATKAPAQAKISEYYPPTVASLALDGQDNLYLTEIRHGCILHVDLAAQRIRRVVESRSPGYPPKGIDGLAFGPDGTAWVVNGATAAVEAYRPAPNGPWPALQGIRIDRIRNEPLQLKDGGCGIMAGHSI